MTVAMMSRITLHLKKEAHATWDSLGLYSSGDPIPVSPSSGRYAGLRFGRGAGMRGGASRGTAVHVAIQEYSVTHDDRGDEIGLPAPTHVHHSSSSKPGREPHAEWHELGPVRVKIPGDGGRSRAF